MIEMSVEVLDGIEQKCRTLPNYRSCIICEDSSRARDIQNALIDIWGGATADRYFMNGLAIRFTATNSVVRIMTQQELQATLLYSCHEAVVDIGMRLNEEDEQKLSEIIVRYELPSPVRVRDVAVFADNIFFDEFSYESVLNQFADGALGYTIYVENGSSIKISPKVPDFGDFPPSQELNQFIETIVKK